MAKVRDTDYVFLCAYLRAKEAKMLSGEMLDNLLTGGSFADAVRSLTECGYEDMSEMNSQQVEAALTRYRNAELQDIAEAAAQKELVDLFRLPYDYHNAKVLVKTGGTPGSAEKLLSCAGRIPAEELLAAFQEEDYTGLPDILAASLAQATSVLATTQNPQLSDMLLDHAYYAEARELAGKIGDDFVSEYVRLLIDSANLRCTVRALRMKRDLDFMGEALIVGGCVPKEMILSLLAADGDLASLYSFSPLKEAALLGENAIKGEGLTAFELAADNAVVEFLSGAGRITFGAGPVLAYLSALENQTTSLRMILTGWLMNIPAETIRERLRENNA